MIYFFPTLIDIITSSFRRLYTLFLPIDKALHKSFTVNVSLYFSNIIIPPL